MCEFTRVVSRGRCPETPYVSPKKKWLSQARLTCALLLAAAVANRSAAQADITVGTTEATAAALQLVTGNSSISATNSITIGSPVTWSSAQTLTLNAGTSININAALDGGASGAMTLIALGTVGLGADLKGSSISITNTGALTRSAGTITATTLTLAGAGTVATAIAPLSTDLGTLVLNSSSGNTYVSDLGSLTVQGTIGSGGSLNVTAATGLTFGSTNIGGTLNATATTGGITATSGLTTGTLVFNSAATLGGSISGAQTYKGAVSLGSATSLSGSSIAFDSTIDGANNLTINSPGAITLGGAVGGTTPLTQVSIVGAGTLALNGGAVTTSGTGVQSYGSPVTLGADTTLTSTGGGAIGFSGTIDGSHALTASTTGTTTFGAAVGGTNALTSLAVSGGATAINGGAITTSGAQTYSGAVSLGSNTALTSSTAGVAVASVSAGNNHSLTINAAGASTLGTTTGLASLTKSGTGTLTLSGASDYTGATTISGGTLAISAENNLGAVPTLETAGNVVFDGGTLQTTATVDLDAKRGISLGTGGGTFSPDASTTLTVKGVIAGGALTKTGTGTLVLAGANTYGGGTFINAGTLTLSDTGSLTNGGDVTLAGSGIFSVGNDQMIRGLFSSSTASSVALQSGKTLTINLPSAGTDLAHSASTFGGSFTGAGTLNLEGPGTLRLTNGGALGMGAFTLNSGTLELAADISTNFGAAAFTVSGPATVVADRIAPSLFSNVTQTLGTLSLGAPTLSVTRGSNLTGTSNTGTVAFGATTLTANASVAIGTNAGLTLGAVTSGANSLTKSGTGTLTFAGDNTAFTGTLSATDGKVSLANASARGSGAWTFTNSAVLNLNAAGALNGADTVVTTFGDTAQLNATVDGAITGGRQDFGGNSVLKIKLGGSPTGVLTGGAQNFSDSAVLSVSATNAITGGTQTFTSLTNPLGDTTFTVDGFTSLDDTTVGNLLKSTARLTVDRVSGNDAITGGSQVFNGYSSLQANHAYALSGWADQTFNDFAHLRASRTDSVAGGYQTFNGSSFLWARGIDEFATGLVSGGMQTFNNTSSLIAGTSYAVTGGMQDFHDSAGAFANATNAISGSSLFLRDNSFVQAGADDALSSSTHIMFVGPGEETAGGFHTEMLIPDGRLLLNGYGVTVGGIHSTSLGKGLIQNGGDTDVTLTVAGTESESTFDGIMQDGGTGRLGLSLTGGGRLTLTGTNTFTGETSVDYGALRITNSNALGATSAGTTIQSGATLELAGNISIAEPLSLSGSGWDGDGALANVSGANSVTGQISLLDCTTIHSASESTLTIAGGIQGNNTTLTIAGYGNTIISSPLILGSGSLIKNDTGALTIAAPNWSTGDTTLNEGTLLIGDSAALGKRLVIGSSWQWSESSPPTLAATTNLTIGSSIELSGYNQLTIGQSSSAANLTLTGFVGPGQYEDPWSSTLNYTGGGTLTFAGGLSVGELAINAAGTGGVVVAGTTWSDMLVTLDQGMLTFTSRGATVGRFHGAAGTTLVLGSAANLVIQDGEYDGEFDQQGTITGAGSLTLRGSYIDATLAGNNSFSGGVTLAGNDYEDDVSLSLGHNNALGTGTLRVKNAGGTLTTTMADLNIGNAISLETKPQFDYSYFGFLGLNGDYNFTLSGAISGVGGLDKWGSNTVHLSGNNTFSGGILLESGTLSFDSDTAAGNGPLVIGDDSEMSATAVFTTAAPVVHGLSGEYFNSTIQLANNSTLTIDQNKYSEYDGAITGTAPNESSANNAKLLKTGYGTLVLAGLNSYTGGTTVNGGGLIFGSSGSLPTTGSLTVGANGYLGLAQGTDISISTFLGRFDKPNTHGSIGFDTDSGSFAVGSIDLTGFASDARLGSASHAVIASDSTLTPQSTTYRFGGGGGRLDVETALTDQTTPSAAARSVVVESPSTSPLTVRLTSTGNTFTGGVNVTQSALVFGDNAMPATGSFTLGTGGYIGTEDAAFDADATAFLNRFSVTTTGIIGFDRDPDSTALTPRIINANLDLSRFTSATPYLGSSTLGHYETNTFVSGIKLTGTITPGADHTYRFAGFKGGAIDVNTALGGTNNLVIGNPSVPATVGDQKLDALSTVFLSGENAFTGNITLYGGQLFLDHANALGTATNSLIVQWTSLPAGLTDEPLFPKLLTNLTTPPVFANPVTLSSTLTLGGINNFTLNGAISGAGGLYVDAESSSTTFTLGGSNSFGGGIYIERGTLALASDTAAGSSTLSFGVSNDGSVVFSSANPTIGGLASDHYGTTVTVADGSTLTINQATDTTYRGTFTSPSLESPTGVSIVKTGSGTLRLEGSDSSFVGKLEGETRVGTDIKQGTVVIGSDAYMPLGSSAIKISGGTLALDHGWLPNAIVSTSTGTIAGSGYFGGDVVIGAGMTLSPGFNNTSDHIALGQLTFNTLTLASGGTLDWTLQSLSPGGFPTGDMVIVSSSDTLTITATEQGRFNVNLTALQPDGSAGLTGLQAGRNYSWTLIQYQTDGLDGFTGSNQFLINASPQFLSAVLPGSLSISTLAFGGESGTSGLMLNFTAVPEPSTWALLLSGLGLLGAGAYRRRRRRQ
jgi:autotransporter-associated beta strand protein